VHGKSPSSLRKGESLPSGGSHSRTEFSQKPGPSLSRRSFPKKTSLPPRSDLDLKGGSLCQTGGPVSARKGSSAEACAWAGQHRQKNTGKKATVVQKKGRGEGEKCGGGEGSEDRPCGKIRILGRRGGKRTIRNPVGKCD